MDLIALDSLLDLVSDSKPVTTCTYADALECNVIMYLMGKADKGSYYIIVLFKKIVRSG